MVGKTAKPIDEGILVSQYDSSNISIRDLAKKFGIDIKRVRKILKESNSEKFNKRTRSFGRVVWNKGLTKHDNDKVANIAKKLSKHRETHGVKDGYSTVYCDKLRTRLKKHTHVWFENTGYLPNFKNNEQIHHIDGDKHNNDFDNLMLVSVSEHTRIHKKYEELTFKLMQKGYVSLNKQTGELETEFLWRMLNEDAE